MHGTACASCLPLGAGRGSTGDDVTRWSLLLGGILHVLCASRPVAGLLSVHAERLHLMHHLMHAGGGVTKLAGAIDYNHWSTITTGRPS